MPNDTIQQARDVLAKKIALNAVLTDPDVLAAIDRTLDALDRYSGDDMTLVLYVEPIAAAIIAADERMSA